MTNANLIRRAFALADDQARALFDCECYISTERTPSDGRWRVIPPREERDGGLSNVLAYLRARKMLIAHPTKPMHRVVRSPIKVVT